MIIESSLKHSELDNAKHSELWGARLVSLPLKNLSIAELCHLYGYNLVSYGPNSPQCNEIITEAETRLSREYDEIYNEGREEGYNEGYTDGQSDTLGDYEEAYDDGYSDAKRETEQ